MGLIKREDKTKIKISKKKNNQKKIKIKDLIENQMQINYSWRVEFISFMRIDHRNKKKNLYLF